MNKLMFRMLLVTLFGVCGNFTLKAQTTNDQLSYLYANSFESIDSLEFRMQFFNAYPSTFLEFRKTYNNPKSSLYSQKVDHFQLFSNLGVIDDTIFMNKLIDLSLGGFWDADMVYMLQLLIAKKALEQPELLGYLMQKRTPAQIRSYFYFFFDGIHVRYVTAPKQLEVLKNPYPFTYNLMKSSLDNVISDREFLKSR